MCITRATAVKLSKSQQENTQINQPNICPTCFPKKLEKKKQDMSIHNCWLMLHL